MLRWAVRWRWRRGATYYLVSQETSGGDQWHDVNNTTVTTTAVASEIGGVYGSGPGSWFAYGVAGNSYGPVDFKYSGGSTGGRSDCRTLVSGQYDDTVDAGAYSLCAGQIGDFVWNNVNGNGCQDPNKPGLPGVRVDLLSGCGPTAT